MTVAVYNKTCSKNVSGNSKVFVAEAANVSAITVTAGEISGITGNLAFKEIQADFDTIIRVEEKIDGKLNYAFDTSVGIKIAQPSAYLNTLRNSLADASPCGMLSIVRDNNGVWWLVGYNEIDLLTRCLYLSENNMTSGAELIDLEGNKVSMVLARTLAEPSLPLDATLSAEMDAGTAAYAQFAGIFVTEYQTLYDSLTTKPSAAIADAQDTMVRAFIDAGVWAKLDLFYLFAQTVNSASEALKNWVSPGTFDATAVNSPAFDALEGFTSNGSTSYINLNYRPVTDATNYAQNSACGGVYIRTNVAEDMFDFGVFDDIPSSWLAFASRYAADNAYHRINDSTADLDTNTDSRGMFIMSRTGAALKKTYKNKILLIDDTTASKTPPDKNVYALANNSNDVSASQFSTKQISLLFLGAGLTLSEVEDATDAIEAYMDSNGKGVI